MAEVTLTKRHIRSSHKADASSPLAASCGPLSLVLTTYLKPFHVAVGQASGSGPLEERKKTGRRKGSLTTKHHARNDTVLPGLHFTVMDNAQVPSLITTGLVVVSVVFPILSLGSVLLRLKARMRTKAGLLGDDWWMVATWVSRRHFDLHFSTICGISGQPGAM